MQAALERYFGELGFEVDVEGDADLICAHSGSNQRWLVEAKGVTSQIGLDFRTALGQLVQRMSDASVSYGIGLPVSDQFLAQCRKVSPWLRTQLQLHWFLVNEDGSVKRVDPGEEI